ARLLAATRGVVTDVGGVKRPVADAVDDPRFVPGHPMAGSELSGLDGADESLFEGAGWVLTPSGTSDDASSHVAGTVTRFGAEVVALDPDQHDDLVAIVSHVPHLTAATLMGLADERSEEHLALLRLAAGGFRDMTRIASGAPAIWLDICEQNKDAITRGLDSLIAGLSEMRRVVSESDREGLHARLERARVARMNLPVRAGAVENLVEMRLPIPDRPGAAADVFALAGELGVNIHDFEVVHSVEGDRGIMVLVVRSEHVEVFRGGLMARGFRPGVAKLA
ncbi:MAG: prephenate dehydrogenase/arogenate dehydrogenase family protein, partial [Actinomycetota bacterium]